MHNAGQQMNVIGSPANTVILHWDECETTWAQLPWRDWVRFRGFDDGGLSLLAGAEAGEHYFLVCVLDDRGELANVIPHRYVLSTDGRLVHGFDGLRQAEREEYCRIQLLLLPTIEDSERYTELDARGFAVNLPPPHTVQPLLRALPVRSRAARAGTFCLRSESPVRVRGRIRAAAAIPETTSRATATQPAITTRLSVLFVRDQFDLHRARRYRLLMP